MKKIMAVMMAVMLAGCGAKNGHVAMYESGGAGADSAYQSKPAAAYESKNDIADNESYQETSELTAEQTSEKLVYTGSLTIQTLEYENSVRALKDLIRAKNGIIASEEEYDNDRYWYSSLESNGTRHLHLTVRIPTASFEAFLNEMEGSGKVISRSTNVVNITRQYNDVSVQIEALQKQEKRLLEMMDKAETIEDMIAVESRLTDVQTQLNSFLTQRSSMDRDVEYSTVTISLDEVKVYTDSHPNFFGQLAESFTEGFKSFLYTGGEILLGIVYRLPYLILIGIAVLFAAKKKIWKKLPKISFRRKKKDSTES